MVYTCRVYVCIREERRGRWIEDYDPSLIDALRSGPRPKFEVWTVRCPATIVSLYKNNPPSHPAYEATLLKTP